MYRAVNVSLIITAPTSDKYLNKIIKQTISNKRKRPKLHVLLLSPSADRFEILRIPRL